MSRIVSHSGFCIQIIFAKKKVEDLGPSPEVCVSPRNEEDVEDMTSYGVLVGDAPILPSKDDIEIAKAIEGSEVQDEKVPILNWPSVGTKAVSEYDDNIKIFAGAFPWLFPGGIGDFCDIRNIHLSSIEWAKRLIMFYDGRFVTDRMFCFFALNYIVRRRNQEKGNFFINDFSCTKVADIDALKELIANGNTSFINEISYFTKEVKGSDGFWRMKRSQLYTWVNHHVEFGNGRPDLFLTLSCAEYWWPDIIRLVEERIEIASGNKISLEQKSVVQVMNEWSSVVQVCLTK